MHACTVYEYSTTVYEPSYRMHACMHECIEWMNGCACMHPFMHACILYCINFTEVMYCIQYSNIYCTNTKCMHAWMDACASIHPFHAFINAFHASIHACMHAQYTNILQQYTNLRTECMHACKILPVCVRTIHIRILYTVHYFRKIYTVQKEMGHSAWIPR